MPLGIRDLAQNTHVACLWCCEPQSRMCCNQWRIQGGDRPLPYWLDASQKWWKFGTKMHHFCL